MWGFGGKTGKREKNVIIILKKLSQKLNVSESDLSIYRSQFLQVPQFFLKRMEVLFLKLPFHS